MSSRRRASARVREKPDSTIGNRGAWWREVSRASCVPPRRLGVAYPLAEKSIRIRRTSSLVNCSRQKGQTGLRRGNVFSTILWQQEEHRTWPGRWHSGQKFFTVGRKAVNNNLPQGIEWGMQCGPYSSAHTSQTEPGLSVSMRVKTIKPLPGLLKGNV